MIHLYFFRFQVKENLQQVFSKFLEKGKATIRLKEPPHDLFIDKVIAVFLNQIALGGREVLHKVLGPLPIHRSKPGHNLCVVVQ